MKSVTKGESITRLRNSVAAQLTENPERMTLRVLSFWPINPRFCRSQAGVESAARAPGVAGSAERAP
jgi:hypothetical protein